MYRLRISNKPDSQPIVFLTLGELAKLSGKSRHAIQDLIVRGLLPESNFRTPKIPIKRGERAGGYIDGYRLYSKDYLIPKLAPYLKKNIKRGIPITREQQLQLIEMFKEEKTTLLNL